MEHARVDCSFVVLFYSVGDRPCSCYRNEVIVHKVLHIPLDRLKE